MEWWHGYLALALLVLGAGLWQRDTRAAWVSGLWAAGILLMQLVRTVGEPEQWLLASALWTAIGMVVLLCRSVQWEAICFWTVGGAYLFLAVHHYLAAPGTGGATEILAFALTEVPAVVAALIGGRGLHASVRSLRPRIHRLRRLVGGNRAPDRPLR